MPSLLDLRLEKVFYSRIVKDAARIQTPSKKHSDWRAARASSSFKHTDLFTTLMEARDPDTGRKVFAG